MLTLSTLLWGLSFPLLKAIAAIHGKLAPDSESWFITASSVAPRFLIAGAVLGIMAAGKLRGMTRLELKQGTGLGLFLTLGLFFQVDGLQHTTASVSAFLTQLNVVLIPIYTTIMWRRRPRAIVLAACGIVLAGIAILARFDPRQLQLGRGEAETLLSTVFFTAHILWLERREFSVNDVERATFVMFAVLAILGSVAALVLAPSSSAVLVPWTDTGWLGLTLVLALVCTLYCFTAMNRWQPRISSTEAALIYSLEPVSVAVLALFLPGFISRLTGANYENELVTWQLVAGGSLVTAATLMIAFRKPRPPPDWAR